MYTSYVSVGKLKAVSFKEPNAGEQVCYDPGVKTLARPLGQSRWSKSDSVE